MLLLTCEHGGNHIPVEYTRYFRGARQVLDSHRGYDIGALAVARQLAKVLDTPLVSSETSRLLVDLNRSRHHRQLFSEFTRVCPPAVQERILQDYYQPYRQKVEEMVREGIRRTDGVLHLSIHSFTPQLGRVKRTADIGLLYDPSRPTEKEFSQQLRKATRQYSAWRIRMNYPYRGTADGLTPYLRKLHPDSFYAGIEVEINQALVKNASAVERVASVLGEAIGQIL